MIDPACGSKPGPEQSPAAGRVLPAADVFLETDARGGAGAPESALATALPRLPGPGLWESIAWMTGVHVVQTTAFVLVGAILVIAPLTAMNGNAVDRLLTDLGDPPAMMRAVGSFFSENLLYLAAATQAATFIYGLAALRVRFGRTGVARLGWRRPWAGHWLLVVLMVVPLQILCGRMHEALADFLPEPAQSFAQTMEDLARAPLPALLLLIAVGPAFAEEFLFRGLIGRGLVARWGLVRGVTVTSLLFGIVHVNPSQAIAVIPMGIAMHFVYLATRSFWAPVTLHLLFNTVGAVALKYGLDPALASIPTHVLTASAAMVTAIGVLLWQTRVEYRLPDGTYWNPGYISAEAPPPEVAAVPVRQQPRFLLLAASTLNSLGFVAILWRLAAAS